MDYIENDNDHIGGTTQQLRNAIEQSVRGWVLSAPEYLHGEDSRAEVIEDLTQHLYGNVVMALRFGANTQEARNAAMYQGMADAKVNRDCPHGYRYGNMYGCPTC